MPASADKLTDHQKSKSNGFDASSLVNLFGDISNSLDFFSGHNAQQNANQAPVKKDNTVILIIGATVFFLLILVITKKV